MKRLALASLLALALAAPAAAQTPQRGFDAVYNVSLRGLGVGEFTMNLSMDGKTYGAKANRRSTGLLRAAVGAAQDFRYESHGRVEGDKLRPQRYEHQGGKRNRLVNVTFNGAEVVTVANPTMGMGTPPATTAQRANTIDQVAALTGMALPANPCAGTLPILMDGARRFDFVLAPAGRETVNTRAFKGSAIRCKVDYRPIAGFSDPQEPAQLEFLFAEASNGMRVPIRIEMPTDEGLAVFEAKSFTVR